MSISFNGIPTSLRVPFVYVEFDNSKAQQGPSIQPYKALVIGQKLSTGTKAELSIDQVTTFDQAKSYFGAGSLISHQLKSFFANNKITQCYAMSQDDHGSGVAATGSITFGGIPTQAGAINLYVAGRKYSVAVTVGQSAASIASAVNAEIGLDADRYITSVVGSPAEKLDFTARNKGEAGNKINVRHSHFEGEALPVGSTATIVAMASGATNPLISLVIAALDETQYNLIVMPYLDATNLTALETELADRFGPLRQNDGVAISADRAALGTIAALGNSRNSPHLSILDAAGPSHPVEWSSAAAAQIALSAQQDPARPVQTLPLNGIVSPNKLERRLLSENNSLLYDGIATHSVDSGGVVRIQRQITTYKTNAFSAADTSLLEVETLLTLSYLRYSFRNIMLNRYSRHKLANDGTRFGTGQKILTPLGGRAEAINIFRGWEELGLVEGFEQFKRDLIVERNAQDPNRLDFLLPPDLVNQLRVVGAQIQFLL